MYPDKFVRRTWVRITAEFKRKAKEPANYKEANMEFERQLKNGNVVKVGYIGIANQVLMYEMKKN